MRKCKSLVSCRSDVLSRTSRLNTGGGGGDLVGKRVLPDGCFQSVWRSLEISGVCVLFVVFAITTHEPKLQAAHPLIVRGTSMAYYHDSSRRLRLGRSSVIGHRGILVCKTPCLDWKAKCIS